MSNLVQLFNKDLELHVVHNSEDQIDIHFGEVLNNQVKQFYIEIEKALKAHCKSGCATIITTQGTKTSLLTVLYFAQAVRCQDKLVIEYL